MKRLYAALVIALLLAGLYILQINTAAKTLQSFSEKMEQSYRSAYSMADADIALEEFENSEQILRIFVDEDKLERISETARRYIAFADGGMDAAARAEYCSLTVLLSDALETSSD